MGVGFQSIAGAICDSVSASTLMLPMVPLHLKAQPKRRVSMKSKRIRGATLSATLGFFLVIGPACSTDCQAEPSTRVRHPAISAQSGRTVAVIHKHCWWRFWHYGPNPITQPALAEVSPTCVLGMDFNSPTVGSPLFYDGGNLNWEEAPPFGIW